LEWIFSIGLTPKKKGISFVPQELPPFLYGSNPIEKTAKPARPTFTMKIVVRRVSRKLSPYLRVFSVLICVKKKIRARGN
jgi:hypothetical protein